MNSFEHSWVWNPFYGAIVEPGYGQHRLILERFPELYTCPRIVDGEEIEDSYDPPRGYFRIEHDEKRVLYVRYDRTKFGTKGVFDRVDATEIEKASHKALNVPNFEVVFYGPPELWHNLGNFKLVNFPLD